MEVKGEEGFASFAMKGLKDEKKPKPKKMEVKGYELLPAKLVNDHEDAIRFMKKMGWPSACSFYEETDTTPDELIGRWYIADADWDGNETRMEDVRVFAERCPTVFVCADSVYFGFGTLYIDSNGKYVLDMKEVG